MPNLEDVGDNFERFVEAVTRTLTAPKGESFPRSAVLFLPRAIGTVIAMVVAGTLFFGSLAALAMVIILPWVLLATFIASC